MQIEEGGLREIIRGYCRALQKSINYYYYCFVVCFSIIFFFTNAETASLTLTMEVDS